jgi:hypothetical protein
MDDSPIWADLLKIRNLYLRGRRIDMKSWENSLFWTDDWWEGGPICVTFPVEYELCLDKNITVKAFHQKSGVLRFRRWLPVEMYNKWKSVCKSILMKPLWLGGMLEYGRKGKWQIFCQKYV